MTEEQEYPNPLAAPHSAGERHRRWRLVLGSEEEQGDQNEAEDGQAGDQPPDRSRQQVGASGLSEEDQEIDEALEALYGDKGGLGDSVPDIARWLGDIRTYFPKPMAQLMQQDALKRLNLRQVLKQPDLIDALEPDLDLMTQLLALNRVMPAKTRETAKEVVRELVEALQARLEQPLRQAITGSLNRALRNRRPRQQREINWLRTIRANLRHYQPAQRTIIPETLIGYGRRESSLRDVILCLDQSSSMAQSVVYASICAAVMASIQAIDTRLVAFGTRVVDLTDELEDPVELLFGIQLRGGTNIDQALAYCQQLVSRPRDTILVLISDLYEGGNKVSMVKRTAALVADGVQVIVLLALDDKGTPRFNRTLAQELVDLGIPSFACTPDLFPDLMAAAIKGQDIGRWAAAHQIVTAPSN